MTKSLRLDRALRRRFHAIRLPLSPNSNPCDDPRLALDLLSFLKGHTTLYWNERTGELRFVPRK